MSDALTIENIKAMFAALQAMRQPEYVVLANANDPLLPELRKLGYEVWVFDDDTLPAVEEGNVMLLDKSKVPIDIESARKNRERNNPKFEYGGK